MSELTRSEIFSLVNRYIGVSQGYLGDFSYRTHAEFYLEFCDLDINPSEMDGTTRERFIAILTRSDAATQAQILRGVLKKYPVGSAEHRTPDRIAEIQEVIRRLDAGCGVPSKPTTVTSGVVDRAIADAETLLRTTGAPSGIDRMHTAFHGFLRLLCKRSGIQTGTDASITELYKLLRQSHPALQHLGSHTAEVDRVLKSFAAAVDSLNTLRNRASVAHPNENILRTEEAYLYVNAVRTLMAYLDAKVSSESSYRIGTQSVENMGHG